MATLDARAEALKQVALADRLVVTKCDRAPEAAIVEIEARLARLNPGARRLRSSAGHVDPAQLFDTGLYRGERVPMDATGWLNAGAYRRVGASGGAPVHDGAIGSFVWRHPEPLAWEDVEMALETLIGLLGARILRMKGLVHVAGEPGPRAVHAVQHTLYPSARLAAWPDADRDTRLVFIGRSLDPEAVVGILQSFQNKASPWQPQKAT
jgi:G3E family GTPase